MAEATSCGCGSSASSNPSAIDNYNPAPWMDGFLDTPAGLVPRILTKLTWVDYLGAFSARWGWNRMDYQIPPGIYAAGIPDENSPVLVTANYKLTFDSLRKHLTGIDAWILVLDTKGINVWCAAGKGTFGTKELVNRIIAVKLDQLVKHRRMILPQLGAVGVAAHTVMQFTRFKVIYGPVYARDIPEYLADGMVKAESMKRVEFRVKDRIILIPIELMSTLGPLLILMVLGIGFEALRYRRLSPADLTGALPFLGAVLTGTVLFPVLLPWIPGRSFALKGAILGLIYTSAVMILSQQPVLKAVGTIFLLTPVISYIALNFTGATTFTSQSGVLKETKVSLPVMAIIAAAGLVMLSLSCVLPFIK